MHKNFLLFVVLSITCSIITCGDNAPAPEKIPTKEELYALDAELSSRVHRVDDAINYHRSITNRLLDTMRFDQTCLYIKKGFLLGKERLYKLNDKDIQTKQAIDEALSRLPSEQEEVEQELKGLMQFERYVHTTYAGMSQDKPLKIAQYHWWKQRGKLPEKYASMRKAREEFDELIEPRLAVFRRHNASDAQQS